MDFISFFVVIILMLMSFQYNYDIFSAIVILAYSIFSPSKINFVFVALFAFLLLMKEGTITFLWLIILIFLIVVILVRSFFGSKSDVSEESYEDLAKLLGGD